MNLSLRLPLALLLAATVLGAGVATARAAGPEVGVSDDRILLEGGADADKVVGEWRADGVDVVRIFALWSRIAPAQHSERPPAGFDAATTEAARAWLSDSWHLVHPSGSGGVYANFPDTDLPDEQRAYWGGNLERVRRVKKKYDPERVFG